MFFYLFGSNKLNFNLQGSLLLLKINHHANATITLELQFPLSYFAAKSTKTFFEALARKKKGSHKTVKSVQTIEQPIHVSKFAVVVVDSFVYKNFIQFLFFGELRFLQCSVNASIFHCSDSFVFAFMRLFVVFSSRNILTS